MAELDIPDLSQPEQEPIFQNLYDLTESDKEDILKEQNDRLRSSLRYMGQLYPGMIKAYKKYRAIAEPLKDELGRTLTNRANIYVPYPWAIVESEMPRLAGRLPRVHAFPRRRTEQEKVSAIQDLILYSLDRMQFLKLQQLWIRQFEIYGWSPLFYYWHHETRECYERVRGVDGSYQMERNSKTIWDDFSARVIDVFDSFIQPGVETIEDGDWFMFREWMSKKDIKARVDGGIFYQEVLKYIEDNPSSSGQYGRENDSREERDTLTGLIKDFQKHSFGRYEVTYTLENDKIIVMIDGKVLARVGDNPNPIQEKPLINLNLLALPNEPIGISTIESLGGLPDKLNALTNARLDNISLLINRVVIANRFSNTDFSNIVMSAGNVILTDDIESSLKFLEIPDINVSSEREISTTKEELQFVSGISDYLVGTKSSARLADTATGVSSVIREANARFALKLSTFEAYPLRKLVEAIHTYNMMYMSEERRIHVLGPKGYIVRDVKLEDILCECDFIVEPGSSAPLDQQSRRDALTGLLDRVIQLPQVVDMPKFMREVFESYDIRNPEDLLLTSNEQLPEIQDAALAEAEDIALTQGQEIELLGNDQIHIPIHARHAQEETDPVKQQLIMSHLQAHVQRQQMQLAQTQQAGQNDLFGAPAPQIGGPQNGQTTAEQNPAPPSGSAPAPQGPPLMGGSPGTVGG